MIEQQIDLRYGLKFMELRPAEMQICYIQQKTAQNEIPAFSDPEFILDKFQIVDLREIGTEK